MNAPFVVDASVTIAWVRPAQGNPESVEWLEKVGKGSLLIVPSLWSLEVANALIVLQRRGRILVEERRRALFFLGELPVEIDDEASRVGLSRLSDLAAEQDLSVYDAAYLELANRRRLPLACKDGPLRAAAGRLGIPVQP